MENDEKQKISKEIINFPKANFRLKFHEGYWLWDWEFNSDDKLELYRNVSLLLLFLILFKLFNNPTT